MTNINVDLDQTLQEKECVINEWLTQLRRTDDEAGVPDVQVIPEDLGELAVKINDAHALCRSATNTYAEYALKAGEFLLQVKATVGHGAWLSWIHAHCTFSHRTAQLYIQIAKKTRTSDHSNAQRAAHLGASIRERWKPSRSNPKSSSSRGRRSSSGHREPTVTLFDVFTKEPSPWVRADEPGRARTWWIDSTRLTSSSLS